MTANQGARRDAYKNHQIHHDPAVRGLIERARAEGAAAALAEAVDELPPSWSVHCPTTRSEFVAWLQGRATAIESPASDAGAGEGGGE